MRIAEGTDAAQRRPYSIPSACRRQTAAIVYGGGGRRHCVIAGGPILLLVLVGILAALVVWHLMSAWPSRC
jgi:hypothetical protein